MKTVQSALVRQAVALCDKVDRRCEAMLTTLGATEKPEVDLKSWIELGRNVKPPRTDRRQKKTWKRARV